jgi:hypothetical protein
LLLQKEYHSLRSMCKAFRNQVFYGLSRVTQGCAKKFASMLPQPQQACLRPTLPCLSVPWLRHVFEVAERGLACSLEHVQEVALPPGQLARRSRYSSPLWNAAPT